MKVEVRYCDDCIHHGVCHHVDLIYENYETLAFTVYSDKKNAMATFCTEYEYIKREELK